MEYVDYNNIPPPSDFRIVKEATECTDPFRLSVLANHPDSHVRARVAENPHTPMKVLRKFVTDSDFVKHYLIRNPKIPISIVKILVESESTFIKSNAHMLLLKQFETNQIEMTAEELYAALQFFLPEATTLEITEYMERAYELKESTKTRK